MYLAETDLSRQDVVRVLQQTRRLLRSHFPRNDGPDATLVVNTLSAQEELSRGFRFEVELLSDDASIPLKDVLGKMMTVALVRDNGTERHFNGYITEFRYLKTDGGFVHYLALLEPWLAFARLRTNCRTFKGGTVLEMTEKTFYHYLRRDWKFDVHADMPIISYQAQYNETDYNHLHRRWEAAGLHYWYEHRADGHTLWLADDSRQADPIDACGTRDVEPGTIAYHALTGSAEGDGISQWQAVRRMGSGSTALASFDYKQPAPWVAGRESENEQGDDIPPYEVYENLGEYGYADDGMGEAMARRRMEEADKATQYFEAIGNDRAAMPGRRFVLADHHSGKMTWPVRNVALRDPIGKREYLITAVRHWAGNNIHSARHEPSYYRNEFTCLRRTIRWRPGRNFHSTPCPAPGVQTAIVTGPPGEEIHTDGYGRVKVQFHWDREGKRDDNSSGWVRVAMPMAGGRFGQIGLPRIGQEVVVQFLGDNPDRPIITGVVYNERQQVPWQLPQQRALSGMRSKEIGSTRTNQLVLDDTKDAIQAQLRSDHLHSQLSLGQIHRLEGNPGHEEKRGDGFELRTDGHGVARAAQGMLLTTESRPAGAEAVKAMNEATLRLAKAHDRHEALAASADQHDAESSGAQPDSAKAIAAQNDEIKGGGQFPELTAPHMVLSSAAGIAATAVQSVHVAGGQQIALTAGANVSVTAHGGFFASVREGARMFVQKLGMKLIAASGKVEVRAETDEMDILAQKVLRLISETDWIDLRGRKGVRLHGAGSMIEIADKVQVYSLSTVQFHCNIETLGPQNRPQSPGRGKNDQATQADPSDERIKLRPLLQPHSALGEPYVDTPYVLYKDGAEIKTGLTDDEGRIEIDHEPGTERYEVMLGNGDRFALHVEPFIDSAEADDEKTKSNQGYRALNDATDGREHKY